MAAGGLATRNVRPVQADDYEDGEEESGDQEMYREESDGEEESESEGDGNLDDDLDGSESAPDESNVPDISTVSFGALRQAQDSLSRKRKRNSDTNDDQQEKLEALRARLRQIKAKKQREEGSSDLKPSKDRQKSRREDVVATVDDQGSDSDSAPSEIGATKSRSSKHAPKSQSTRYQVTRRRNVVEVPKRITRDPRFDALHETSINPDTNRKAYSFLRDYQKAEISELRSALKLARTEEDKVTLRRKLVSMENRIKSEDAKEREQNVLRQHRKEERDKVQQGKKPFYLKNKEVKERALVEKFKGMKGKDRQKLVERRRVKESQKERKRMPEARRVE